MKKTLVTAGCSFTQDYYQKTWADYLAESLDYELVNIAARGAGMDFISKRTITHLSQSSKDSLVVIMLPSSDRFDYYTDSKHPLKHNFLNIASWQKNRRPELVNLDGSVSSSHGYSLTGGEHRGNKKYWYKYFYNKTNSLINFWFNVHSLQTFLQLNNIKYFFTTAYNLNNTVEQCINDDNDPLEYTDMLNLIDFNRFIFYKNQCGFLEFVADNKFKTINHHPETLAHKEFVNRILLNEIQ